MSEHRNEELARWVEGCKEGSHRAQHKLFKHFYSPMLRLCMRYADSTDEAEDMLSEGFMKVFTNIGKYETTGSFESWMKRVMVNAALDHRRKYDAKVGFTDLEEVADSTTAGYDINAALGRMSADEVMALIQKLPPTTRTVFNLFVFDGFSHTEIAQQLNISEGTSAWHVNAARTRIKNKIQQLNNE